MTSNMSTGISHQCPTIFTVPICTFYFVMIIIYECRFDVFFLIGFWRWEHILCQTIYSMLSEMNIEVVSAQIQYGRSEYTFSMIVL